LERDCAKGFRARSSLDFVEAPALPMVGRDYCISETIHGANRGGG
jgi:hypothetical protein